MWSRPIDRGQVEHQVGHDRADGSAEHLRRQVDGDLPVARRPPKNRSASVTTGLKCPPDTGPKARISATRPAPVASAFSSSWRPTSSGDSRCAAMPEPMTTVTSAGRAEELGQRLPGQAGQPHGRFAAIASRDRETSSLSPVDSCSSRSGISRW